MTTQELRSYIDRILGNSLRVLLPSYWWKRLFGLMADAIDDKVGKGELKTVSGESIVGKGDIAIKVNVDSELSETSTNAIQNKAVATALTTKRDIVYLSPTTEQKNHNAAIYSRIKAGKVITFDLCHTMGTTCIMMPTKEFYVSGSNIIITTMYVLKQGTTTRQIVIEQYTLAPDGSVTTDNSKREYHSIYTDTELSASSSNPVTNSAVTMALKFKADEDYVDDEILSLDTRVERNLINSEMVIAYALNDLNARIDECMAAIKNLTNNTGA